MTRAEIERLLWALGDKLAERGVEAEIMVAGGAALMLTLGNRDVTQDVDAFIGGDVAAVRDAAAEVAREHGLPASWLNDAVKRFFYTGTPPHALWSVYGHLTVYVVDPRYLFAMKAAAARPRDIEDMVALARHLGLRHPADGIALIERYIPARFQTPKMRYAVEAAFASGGMVSAAPSPRRTSTRATSGAAQARAWEHGYLLVPSGVMHLCVPGSGTTTLCGRRFGPNDASFIRPPALPGKARFC
jgi:hypothetical protein